LLRPELFAIQLLKWYEHQKRDLPWRNTTDPYLIWLSEIILQQTRIAQGLPYYQRFVQAFPTVYELAEASEAQVLRLWQGLGYYSRARNLHACAQIIVNNYDGNFPTSYHELLQLKGVGKYTAAAISSFAYNAPHAVVDGNVFRVLSRVFGITSDISEAKSFQEFESKANELIDKEQPALFNQAIMDFGALQCSPKKPACALCPLSDQCYAFNHGMIADLPVKSKKVKVKKKFFSYLVLEYNDNYCLKERGAKDIWQGLFDFPLIDSEREMDQEEVLNQIIKTDQIVLTGVTPTIKHVLTHRHIFARFYRLEVKDLNTFEKLKRTYSCGSFTANEIQALPKPILIENYLKEEVF
jgi:A/G-specific adenine glycosylase